MVTALMPHPEEPRGSRSPSWRVMCSPREELRLYGAHRTFPKNFDLRSLMAEKNQHRTKLTLQSLAEGRVLVCIWVGNTTNSDLPYLMGSTGSLLGLPTGHSAKDNPTHRVLGLLCFSRLSKVCCSLMHTPFLWGHLPRGLTEGIGLVETKSGPVLL